MFSHRICDEALEMEARASIQLHIVSRGGQKKHLYVMSQKSVAEVECSSK